MALREIYNPYDHQIHLDIVHTDGTRDSVPIMPKSKASVDPKWDIHIEGSVKHPRAYVVGKQAEVVVPDTPVADTKPPKTK